MDTPPPVSSAPSPGSLSPTLTGGVNHFLSRLPGTSVQLYALHLIAPSLSAPEPRYSKALLACVVVTFPVLASSVLELFRRSLSKQ